MASRSRSNPLALAVLTCLYEKPMHPYEISQTLRERGVDRSVRLNFGSLYSVVESLEKRELIRAGEKIREGRRPERTTYEITDAGTDEMTEWLTDLVTTPAKEYLQFEAGLALLGALHPDKVVALLEQRAATLAQQIDADAAEVADAQERFNLPRLFLLEAEYQLVLQRADLEWTRQLVADIEDGSLGGLKDWRLWHESGRRSWPTVHGPEAQALTQTDNDTQTTNGQEDK
jgi:DNA-binding PadR family transcriptional regulator